MSVKHVCLFHHELADMVDPIWWFHGSFHHLIGFSPLYVTFFFLLIGKTEIILTAPMKGCIKVHTSDMMGFSPLSTLFPGPSPSLVSPSLV